MKEQQVPSNRAYRLFVHGARLKRNLPSRVHRLVAVAGMAATVVGSYCLWVEPRWIKVNRISLSLPMLPPELEGLTLVHLSDLHAGPHVNLDQIRKAVQISNSLHPHIVALTGDYVSESAAYIPDVCQILSKLEAVDGVYAVMGNHDHWEGVDAIREGFTNEGITVLDNDHTILTRRGAPYAVAGVEDLWDGHPDFDVALEGLDDDTFRIALAHNPDVVDLIGNHRVDLLLCGHTHGGQVRIPFLGAPALPIEGGQQLSAGLSLTDGGTRVYVNTGVGVIFPPIRLLCRPEIAHFTLTSAGADDLESQILNLKSKSPSPPPSSPLHPRGGEDTGEGGIKTLPPAPPHNPQSTIRSPQSKRPSS